MGYRPSAWRFPRARRLPRYRPLACRLPGAEARRWRSAGALALGPRVLREQVQGAALRVDEHLTETARRDVDRSLPCPVGLRRRPTRLAVAAATGEAQREDRNHGQAGDEGDASAASHARPFRWEGRIRSPGPSRLEFCSRSCSSSGGLPSPPPATEIGPGQRQSRGSLANPNTSRTSSPGTADQPAPRASLHRTLKPAGGRSFRRSHIRFGR